MIDLKTNVINALLLMVVFSWKNIIHSNTYSEMYDLNHTTTPVKSIWEGKKDDKIRTK